MPTLRVLASLRALAPPRSLASLRSGGDGRGPERGTGSGLAWRRLPRASDPAMDLRGRDRAP